MRKTRGSVILMVALAMYGLTFGLSDLAAQPFAGGWFDGITALNKVETIRESGCKYWIGYSGETDPLKYTQAFDAAAANGMLVIPQIPLAILTNKDQSQLRAIISSPAPSGGKGGWLLVDEPDNRKTPVTELKLAYNLIKKIDPNTSVFIILRHPNVAERYLPACDVILTDDYPISVKDPDYGSITKSSFAGRINSFSKLAEQNNKSFGVIIQGFGEAIDGKPQFDRRLPKTDEIRLMLDVCVLNRSEYIFFWTLYRSQVDWVKNTMSPAFASALSRFSSLSYQGMDCLYQPDYGLALYNRQTGSLAFLNMSSQGFSLFEGLKKLGLPNTPSKQSDIRIEPLALYLK